MIPINSGATTPPPPPPTAAAAPRFGELNEQLLEQLEHTLQEQVSRGPLMRGAGAPALRRSDKVNSLRAGGRGQGSSSAGRGGGTEDAEKRSRPFRVEDLPIALQETPLYVMCTMLAGELSEPDLNKMFDLQFLATETETVTLKSVHHIPRSGFLKAASWMDYAYKLAKRTKPNWLLDIATNMEHDLYMEFIELAAAYIRENSGQRVKGESATVSRKEQALKRRTAEIKFTKACGDYSRNKT